MIFCKRSMAPNDRFTWADSILTRFFGQSSRRDRPGIAQSSLQAAEQGSKHASNALLVASLRPTHSPRRPRRLWEALRRVPRWACLRWWILLRVRAGILHRRVRAYANPMQARQV